jgi:hypothetical protein
MEEKIKKPWYKTKKGKFRCIEKGAMNPDGSIYTFRREYEYEDQMEAIYAVFKRKDRINKAVNDLKKQGYFGLNFSNVQNKIGLNLMPYHQERQIVVALNEVTKLFGKKYPLSALFVDEERALLSSALKARHQNSFRHYAGAINTVIIKAQKIGGLPPKFPNLYYSHHPKKEKSNVNCASMEDKIIVVKYLRNLCISAKQYSEFIKPAIVLFYLKLPQLTWVDIELALVSDLETPLLSCAHCILTRPPSFRRLTSKTIIINDDLVLVQRLVTGKSPSSYLFSPDEYGNIKIKDIYSKISFWFNNKVSQNLFPSSSYKLMDLKVY